MWQEIHQGRHDLSRAVMSANLPRRRMVLPSVLLEGRSLLCTEEQGRLCVNSITPTISAKPGSEGKSVTLDLVGQGNCTSRQWKMALRWKLSNQTQIPHLLNRHVLRRYFPCHIWNSIILPDITWVSNKLLEIPAKRFFF